MSNVTNSFEVMGPKNITGTVSEIKMAKRTPVTGDARDQAAPKYNEQKIMIHRTTLYF